MDSLYKNRILTMLNDVVEKCVSEQKFTVLSPRGIELIKLLATGNLSVLPLISLSNEYEYITEDDITTYQTVDSENKIHSNEYNYSETMPARLYPCFTLIATDVSHIIEMEEIIMNNFSSVQQLTIEHPNKQGEKILFDISINGSTDIDRQSKEINIPNLGRCTLYQSIIRLKCENCAMFLPKFHTTQIQLDKDTQLQLIKRGMALETLQKRSQEAQKCNIEQILLARSEIIKLLGLNTFEDYGFTELHQKMIDLKSDVVTANNACIKNAANKKEQMLQEQVRIEAINKEYGKKGDEILNIYTDTIVEDIRRRVADKLNIPVYGGSTYMEWFRLYNVKELKLPNILVTAKPSFTFGRRNYTVIDANGNERIRPCIKDILPLEYQFVVGILAQTEKETEEFKNALIDAYSDTIKIDISVPELNGETIMLKMQYNSANPIALQTLNDSLFGNIYKALLCFNNSSLVYCTKKYTKEDIEDNQRLQLRLLQQALYMLECSEKIKYSYHILDRDYKALITKKNSIFGFLRNEEYKKLKMQFDTGASIDRELFNSVLKDITQFFPSLYDRMLAGWKYEQISEYIQGYFHFFEERHKSICDLLNIPMKFMFLSHPAPRSKDTLRACIDLMDLPDYSLKQALLDFRNYEAERQAQQDAEDAARREARQANGEPSLLGGVLKTAAGVAIGNKISNRRSSVKQDSGRAYYMCPIGCKFKYSEHGVPRCRLSTAWSNSPEPEKCGHGHRYR